VKGVAAGEVELRWHIAANGALLDPLPNVAYTAPCALRAAGLRRLESAGIETYVAAESSHLSGIQTAVRNGLGVALLAGGADGLRTIDEGPLAEPFIARLWLVSNEPVPELAEALRSGLARSRA
jgi:DNA-binding transcriptional LysR family regulator